MRLGTHNSATGGRLLWWLKPFAWLINPTSKCQDKTIQEQLQDGVKVFNLQVAYHRGKWRFSHGLALYKEDVMLTIRQLRAWATKHEPIYIQLYLDKSWWCKQNVEEFEFLVSNIYNEYCGSGLNILSTLVEGTDYHPELPTKCKIKMSEHYWTLGWAKLNRKPITNFLPLPKRHAIKYNAKYKKENNSKYLMLDFYEK